MMYVFVYTYISMSMCVWTCEYMTWLGVFLHKAQDNLEDSKLKGLRNRTAYSVQAKGLQF